MKNYIFFLFIIITNMLNCAEINIQTNLEAYIKYITQNYVTAYEKEDKLKAITKLSELKYLNVFLSSTQMAELIIEQINTQNRDNKIIIELIKLAAKSFDLSKLKDRNFRTILSHTLGIGLSRRPTSIFIICNCYGKGKLLDNSIFEKGVAIELVKIIETFDANKLELDTEKFKARKITVNKREPSCIVM